MVKVIDPALRKDQSGFYTIKAEFTHDDLDILVESLNTLIHKGIQDQGRLQATLTLYSNIFGLWENTTANPTPVDPALVKIPDQPCPEFAHWDQIKEECVPIAGYYKDNDGNFKPIIVNDCGANAHFDIDKGCICNEGFFRDKSGNCVPIPVKEPPIEPPPE